MGHRCLQLQHQLQRSCSFSIGTLSQSQLPFTILQSIKNQVFWKLFLIYFLWACSLPSLYTSFPSASGRSINIEAIEKNSPLVLLSVFDISVKARFRNPSFGKEKGKLVAFVSFSGWDQAVRVDQQLDNFLEKKFTKIERRRRRRIRTSDREIQMVQSINFDGLYYLGKLLRRPRFLLPHIYTENISKVNFRNLKESGIKGVIFDKDNTLTAPYIDEIHPHAQVGYDNARSVFGKENLLILSNSAGTNDDLHHENAKRLEDCLGIHVLRHVHKKPSTKCLPEILEYYKEQGGHEKIEANELLFVGDRILTDVAFGNLCGMVTCFTKILTEEGDNRAAKYIRRVEVKAVNKLLSKGWLPPSHKLFPYSTLSTNQFAGTPPSLEDSKSGSELKKSSSETPLQTEVKNRNDKESFYYFTFHKYLSQNEKNL